MNGRICGFSSFPAEISGLVARRKKPGRGWIGQSFI
jgi:hypothetical protein